MNIKSLLVAVMIVTVFAFGLVSITTDITSTYSSVNESTSGKFQEIKDEQDTVQTKMNSTQSWLKELGEGDLASFTFAMPLQIANVLTLLLDTVTIGQSVLTSLLAGFGIPTFVTNTFMIIIMIYVLLKIVGIWSKGGDI